MPNLQPTILTTPTTSPTQAWGSVQLKLYIARGETCTSFLGGNDKYYQEAVAAALEVKEASVSVFAPACQAIVSSVRRLKEDEDTTGEPDSSKIFEVVADVEVASRESVEEIRGIVDAPTDNLFVAEFTTALASLGLPISTNQARLGMAIVLSSDTLDDAFRVRGIDSCVAKVNSNTASGECCESCAFFCGADNCRQGEGICGCKEHGEFFAPAYKGMCGYVGYDMWNKLWYCASIYKDLLIFCHVVHAGAPARRRSTPTTANSAARSARNTAVQPTTSAPQVSAIVPLVISSLHLSH
jgi:hypothetical protein